MNNNCNYIIYSKHIYILIFLIFLEVAGHLHIDIYIYSIYIIHIHTTPAFLHSHFLSSHWVGTFVSQNHLCVWCLVTLNEIFLKFRSQKGDCIAGVNYLKGVFALFGPRPPVFISGPQLPNPIKISTSSTSSYLDPSHYDHVHITFNGLRVICFMFTYSCYI